MTNTNPSYVHVGQRANRLAVKWAGHIERVVMDLSDSIDAHLTIADAEHLVSSLTAALDEARKTKSRDESRAAVV